MSGAPKSWGLPAKEEEAWYVRRGGQFLLQNTTSGEDWANTLAACQGIIAFDAVLCGGPRHEYSTSTMNVIPHQSIATRALDGCASCGSAPEGWTVWGETTADSRRDPDERRDSGNFSSEIGRFPLLWPPPRHSSSVRVAMCPAGQPTNPRLVSGKEKDRARFIPRCYDCLQDRYCGSCNRWWCETCYPAPNAHVEPGAANDLVSATQPTHHISASKVRDGRCLNKCRRRSSGSLMGHRVRNMALPALHAPI